MAKPELNDLIEWLGRNELNRFEIYDVDQNRTIEKCASYDDLSRSHVTVEAFFADLAEQGVNTVQVVKKRKNGSSYVREGCGLNYAISSGANNNVAASGSQAQPGATPQQISPISTGLMGASNAHGLGLPEIMQMRSQADRYEETKNEYRELKSKVERLEAENKKLETDCLTYKLGNDNKPSAVDKLVEGLAANPAALGQLIQSFKGSGAGNGPGLNSPEQQPNLSETKKFVCKAIQDQKMSDEHVTAAYYVLAMAEANNTDFLQKYHSLLNEFNLISDGSSSDSDRI